MKVYLFLIPLLFILWSPLSAQSIERAVIASSGLSSQAGDLQLSATAGELIVETYQSGSFMLTQGFQQGDTPTNVSNDLPLVQVDYRLYPNPTKDWTTLELESQTPVTLQMNIRDLSGKQVLFSTQTVTVQGSLQQRFDLRQLAAGTYVWVLQDRGGRLLKSFRIRKTP